MQPLICKSHIAMMESMNMVTATDSITDATDVFMNTVTTDLVTEGMYYTLKRYWMHLLQHLKSIPPVFQ